MILNNEKRILYVDTIKGLACLFIFIGHFHYGFANKSLGDIYYWQNGLYNLFRLLFNGTFSVSMFCIIAGYFVSWNIDSVYKFFKYSVLRYLRLALPLLILCVSIHLILKVYNPENRVSLLADILNNDWLKISENKSSIWDALYAAFWGILIKGEGFFNLPVWMLRPMFVGQLTMAAFILFHNRCPKVPKLIKYLIFIILPLSACFFIKSSYIIVAVFCGGGYKLINPSVRIQNKILSIVGVASVILFGGYIVSFFSFNIVLYNVLHVALALFLLYLLTCSSYTQIVLSKKWGLFLGKISFAVYLLHMPAILLLAAPLLYSNINLHSYSSLYLFIEVICIIVVLLASYLWTNSIDKQCNKINSYLKSIL